MIELMHDHSTGFITFTKIVRNRTSLNLVLNMLSIPNYDVLSPVIPKSESVDFLANFDRYSIKFTGGVTNCFSLDAASFLNPSSEVMDSKVNNSAITNNAQAMGLTSVSISDAKVNEGNNGETTNALFKVTLSSASITPVSVQISTASDTATSDIDFKSTRATITFDPGQITANFTVPILGDSIFEPSEVFTVQLSNPNGAVLDNSTAKGIIVDDDSPYSGLPTDSFLPYEWYLYDTTGINVFRAWSSYTGRGVRIAVFDWGIDSTNADLSSNVLTKLGRKASDLSNGGSPILSSDNHGTAVAGVIAAAANDYENIGVAFNSNLISIYDTGKISEIANALTYAQNFDILNNSWGFTAKPSGDWAFTDNFSSTQFTSAATALKNLATAGRGGLGTIVVQSAGNAFSLGDDTNLHNFQNSRYIITVGATNYFGSSTSYSTPGASILVSAPGGDGSGFTRILTTDRTGLDGFQTSDYAFMSGTSFSSPIVAGVVALMLEANPLLGYRDVQEILAYSAKITDRVNNVWQYNGANDWNGGGLHFDAFTHDIGYGLVDASAAVRLAETWSKVAKTSSNVYELNYSHTTKIAIPDYSVLKGAGSASDSIRVTKNMRIERIEISLDITHTYIGDLSVTLTSPNTGETSFLISRPGRGTQSPFGLSQDNIKFTVNTVLNWGENSLGDWKLSVFDSAQYSTGTLNSWAIKFIGSPISTDDVYIYTDEFANASADQISRAVLADANGTDTLNASACTSNLIVNLVPGGISTIAGRSLTIAEGTVIENAYGGDGNDSIQGNSFANNLSGMRGNDTLIGEAGNDTIDGGAGIDTADYSGVHTGYTVAIASGEVVLTDKTANRDGSDSVINVERAKFTDGTLALDIAPDQNAGKVYRLYQAAFARTPDIPGVKYHLNDMETKGLPLWQIASNFLASPEFSSKYGSNPSDTQYINALYKNVLNRIPAASEVAWYQNQFTAKAMDHQAALIGFSESPENVALVGSAIANGIWLG